MLFDLWSPLTQNAQVEPSVPSHISHTQPVESMEVLVDCANHCSYVQVKHPLQHSPKCVTAPKGGHYSRCDPTAS